MPISGFNYGTPYGTYPPTDAAGAKDYLNSLSRAIPAYVVAQNLGKLSPLTRRILSHAEVKSISFPFISQPVAKKTINNVQKVDYNMTFNVPAALDTDLAEMATVYANLALSTLFVTDFEVKAFEQGNPNMLYDTVKLRASETWIGLVDQVATWLLGTRVSGGSEDTTQFYGLKDIVDDGTNLDAYANISRSSNAWWQSYFYDANTLWGAGLKTYQYVMRALTKYMKAASTMGMPDVGFCSPAVWQTLAESFTAIEQYIVADTKGLEETREYQVTGIAVQGVPIFPDPYIADASGIYFINWSHLKFVFCDGYAVTASEWKDLDVVGKLAYFSYLLFGGQLFSDAPIAHFRLYNIPNVIGNI